MTYIISHYISEQRLSRVEIAQTDGVSMVNVIYGSIAITVVALLSIEVVAIILLLGAQVISETGERPS